jgi:hypothetical protein
MLAPLAPTESNQGVNSTSQVKRKMALNEVSTCSNVVLMASSNVGSAETPNMEVDTPDNNTDIGLQYEYPWSDKDWNTLQDYKTWLNAEWDRVEKLESNGPTSDPWPKKPKTDIRKLGVSTEGLKKRSSDVLFGMELHEYLVKNCVDSSVAVAEWPSPPEGGYTSLESMKNELIVGYQWLIHLDKQVLEVYIKYGVMLNQAFLQHYCDKYAGKLPRKWFKWEDWLKDNVGIKSAYARKLRQVAKVLGPFPGFTKLVLPFSEIHKRLKEIKNLLNGIDQSWAAYWRQS